MSTASKSMTRTASVAFARARDRRAVITMSVLISIGIILALFVAWTKTIVVERRTVAAEQRRLQAEYLATAAIDRAAAQLATSAGYQGETWRIDAATMGQKDGAVVVIRVESLVDQPQARRVAVEARVPEQGVYAARSSRQTNIDFKKAGEAP